MIFLNFLLIGFLGGTTGSLIKYAAIELPPVLLITLRFALSLLILLPFVLKFKIKVAKDKWKLMLISGLFFAANNFLFTIGVKHTSAIMSQLIYVPTSLIVAILGYIFLKEKLRANQILGLFITFVGMGLLAFGSLKTNDIKSFGEPFGNLMISIGLFSWSAFLVLSRKLSQDHSPLSVSFLNFATVLLFSLFLLPVESANTTVQLSELKQGTIIALVAAGFTSAGFVYFFQNFVKRTSAFISSFFVYINPIVATVWGYFLFGEKLTPALGASSFLVFTGVFLATSYNYLREKAGKN